MLFRDIADTSAIQESAHLQSVADQCSQFLAEAGNFPLLKNLPSSYDVIHRVKVRKQKRDGSVSESYDLAFGEQFANLRERAVFATSSIKTPGPDQEPFYVFPIDGFQYLYSKEVLNSSVTYQQVVDLLIEQCSTEQAAFEIVSDILRRTYSATNLIEGIQADAEIIIYNIPCFYAIKVAEAQDYPQLISTIQRLHK